MDLEIKIHQGFGDIKFDMPVEEVVSILGQADEVENIDNVADETTTVLHYNELDLTLFFEGENPVLSCIDLSNEDSTLLGVEIFDLGEKDLCQLMIKNQYFEQDIENEDWGERRISFNEGNIDFYFEDDELLSVSYGK